MYQHGQVIRGHLTVVSQPYRGHGLHEGRRWPLHCWAGEALLSPVPGVEGVLLVHPPVSGLGVVLVAVHDGAGALALGGQEQGPVSVHGIWRLTGKSKKSRSMETGAVLAGHLISLLLTISLKLISQL